MKKLHLLVLLALLMPLRIMADHTEDAYLYVVNAIGTDQLKIEMPVYDEDGYDGWIDDAYIYVTPSGGSRQTLLRYYTVEKDGDKGVIQNCYNTGTVYTGSYTGNKLGGIVGNNNKTAQSRLPRSHGEQHHRH